MGISDRDYYRQTPRRGRSGRSWAGTPTLGRRLGGLSFNSWIIIINVAVFLLNNVVLSDDGFLKKMFLPNRTVDMKVEYGRVFRTDETVTAEQQARAQVDETRSMPMSTLPGDAYGYRLYDPQIVERDEYGRTTPHYIGFQREGYLPPLNALGHFSTARAFGGEIWRFITFQFLHVNLVHLLFNMFGLWFVGGLVEQYLGSRRYVVFYLACGAAGGLMYLLLNLLGSGLGVRLPGVLFNDIYTPLVGASAGVFGVLVAAAFIQPDAIVQVYFIFPMKLRTAVYGLLVLTMVNLLTGSHNAGGEAAHVGGALAGFYLIRRPHILRSIFGLVGSRNVAGSRDNAFAAAAARTEQSAMDWRMLDRVVAKAREHGLASLTPTERRLLRRANESFNGS